MAEIFTELPDPFGFPARASLGSWAPELGWLQVVSEVTIFGAYVSIPAALIYIVLVKRRKVPLLRFGWLFGGLFLAAGIGHAIQALIFWHPMHRLDGAVNALTAMISGIIAIAVVRIIPLVVELHRNSRPDRRLRKEMDVRSVIERELRRSEAEAKKLALVAAHTDNAVIITDAKRRIEWVNAGFTRITGYEPSEVVGKTPGSFLQGPETDPETVAFIRDRLNAGEAFRAEIVNYGKGGLLYWLSMEVQPIRDDEGRLTHFMAIEADVTERKRSERALEQRTRLAAFGGDVGLSLTQNVALRDQLQAAAEALTRHLDAALARIWTLNADGTTLELQASAGLDTQIDGAHGRVPVGELKIGRIAQRRQPELTNDVLHDAEIGDPEWARREAIVAFAGYPLLVQDRLVGVMAAFGRCPLDEATFEAMGSVANGLALGIERDRDALALRASEARKAAIQETALDAIIIMDDEGRVLEFNPAAESIFGYTAAEATGGPLEDLFVPKARRDSQRRGPDHYKTTREGLVLGRRIEIPAIRKDGSEFPSELAITPIRTGGQTIFTAHLRDISERRAQEETLRRAKDHAEAANRAKSQFLANMSHEIRTPLTAILGFAEVVRDGGLPPSEQAEYLRTILDSGRHLRTLIDDILDLAKVEAGHMEFEEVPCDPARVINEVVSVLRVRAAEKGLSLEVRWDGRVPASIRTDPVRFRQLLVNLIGNAIKFTDNGGVRVVARLERSEAGPMLIVEIRDTGMGIEAEDLGRIFSPFEQADGSMTRRAKGTGLGLAISRHIAEGLGGELAVSSQMGSGSVFRARIATGPIDGVAMLDEPRSEAIGAVGADGSAVDLTGLHILVVDDGAENRKLIRLVLRRAGAAVTCAADGQECLDLTAETDFDLVLLDMQMPVLDGYQTADRLRTRGFEAPVIALTAHAMRGDDRRCLEAGCSGYLCKPIDIDRLLTTVRLAAPAAHSKPCNGRPAAEATVHPIAVDPASAEEPGGPPLISTLPMDDPEFLEILDEFIAKLPLRLSAMRSAAGRGDFEEVAGLAHWLRGSGGTAGFLPLTEPSARLERAAHSGHSPEVEAAIDAIAALIDRIPRPVSARP